MRLITTSLVALAAAKINLKGVDPNNLHLYEAKQLRCPGENGKILTPEMINDDFCDCPDDGFDEPGTAACSNGKFWCHNAEWKGRAIPSLMVNDGVCDCCDGSDEYEGRIKCPNICEDLRLRHEIEEAVKKNLLATGLVEKKKMVQLAKEIQSKQQFELTQLKVKVTMYENQLEALKNLSGIDIPESPKVITNGNDNAINISNGFEDMCLDLQKRYLKVQSIIKKLKQTASQCPECMAAVKDFEDLESGSKFSGSNFDDNATEDLSSELYNRLTLDGEPLNEETAENHDAEISIWANLKKFGLTDLRSFFSKYTTTKTVTVTTQASPTSTPPELKQNPKEEAELKLMRAEKAYKDLKDKISQDYGPENAFLALKDQCIEMADDKYKYELCWFDKISQKELNNEYGSSVCLGKWDSWAKDFDYKSMKFTMGQACWHGPMRSTTVLLECGPVNEIIEVEEPATCQYLLKVRTPAVCSKNISFEDQDSRDL